MIRFVHLSHGDKTDSPHFVRSGVSGLSDTMKRYILFTTVLNQVSSDALTQSRVHSR
jgi:hypothetical protein